MGAGHDHGGGVESIEIGDLKDHYKPRPKWNVVTWLSLILRLLAIFGCVAHGIVSLLGMNEVLGTITNQEFFLGDAPLYALIMGGLVAVVCGGESLFLETPNSQRTFKALAEKVDDWINDPNKHFDWRVLFLYSPLYFVGGGLVVELVNRYQSRKNEDAAAEAFETEKKAFVKRALDHHYFTLIPRWTTDDVDILFILTFLPHIAVRFFAWALWHSVFKRTINFWYPFVGLYGKDSLPIWYLLIQPIVEPIAMFFGALAGAAEFWMGMGAFLTFLSQSGVPMLVDLATGGLLSAGLGVLIVLFSVAYSNNLFLNGRRAVSSMRDMARGEITLRKKRNDDRRILRKFPEGHPHTHDEDDVDSLKKSASYESLLSEKSDAGHGHAHGHHHDHAHTHDDEVGSPIYYKRVDGSQDKNPDEAIVLSVKRGNHRVESAIYLVEGKPLLNKDGTLFTITDGDVVLFRVEEDGVRTLCDHDGNPFLKDGKPLAFHDIRTATYADGCPLFDQDGYPVLDTDGDLIFHKNPRNPDPKSKTIPWQHYAACDQKDPAAIKNVNDPENAAALQKGFWEHFLTRNAAVFALLIGIVVAVGVGLLGVNTLFAALGVPTTPTLVLSIMAALGYGMQNACLQGTESFTLLKFIGQGLDDFNQRIITEGYDILGFNPNAKHGFLAASLIFLSTRITGFISVVGESLVNGIGDTIDFLIPAFVRKMYVSLFSDDTEEIKEWAKYKWRYVFAKPFFTFAKFLFATVGPVAHGAEAFRAVYVGFPIIIALAVVGGSALAFTPPGWAIALILTFAIIGAAVMGIQNRALEVETAHNTLDDALKAINDGRFWHSVVAPELMRIPERYQDFKEWCSDKWHGRKSTPLLEKKHDDKTWTILVNGKESEVKSVKVFPHNATEKPAVFQVGEDITLKKDDSGNKVTQIEGSRVFVPAGTRAYERSWGNTQKEKAGNLIEALPVSAARAKLSLGLS